jgi:archaellum component FlaC
LANHAKLTENRVGVLLKKMAKEKGFNKTQISQLHFVVAEGITKHVNPQFEEVHKELADIKETLGDHTNRLDGIDKTLADHSSRLDRIETKQDAQQGMLDSHDRRVGRVEKHLDLPA